MATAVLPPLLPTPPRSKMMPLLPTPCLIVLPASFAPPSSKPGRADSVERWDANKKPSSPVSSSSGSSRSPGRASACDRWDSNKIKSPRGTSPASSDRGSRDGSKSPARVSSSDRRWDSNKPPPSRASSAERWDTHKMPRSQDINKPQTDETATKVATAARTEMVNPPQQAVFSGSSFFGSPEPSMLPIPAFLLAH